MNKIFKSSVGMLSVAIIGGTIATSMSTLKVNADNRYDDSSLLENTNDQELKLDILDISELDKLSNINDSNTFNKELSLYLLSKGANIKDHKIKLSYSTRGKATLAAKAAGKSLQALLKKMGKKWWENQTQKWYFPIKVNWKVINGIADFAAKSGGTIEDAIVKYLTSHSIANKQIATAVAKTIVFIAF
jgi:hypothetical protein